MIGKELEVLNTFRTAYNELAPVLDRHGLGEVAEASRTFGDALILFGRCERLARRQERDRALTGAKESKNELAAIAGLNKRGQAALKLAINQLRAAAKTLKLADGGKAPPALKARLADFSADLMPLLSEGDMKPSDILKLKAIQDEVVAATLDKGERGLVEHVLSNMEKLAELRTRPDRGAVDNIPWWKAVAIAAFLGLWVWAVIRCIADRRQCSDVTNAALAAGMTIARLVAYFC
jgi:hypothetical protein